MEAKPFFWYNIASIKYWKLWNVSNNKMNLSIIQRDGWNKLEISHWNKNHKFIFPMKSPNYRHANPNPYSHSTMRVRILLLEHTVKFVKKIAVALHNKVVAYRSIESWISGKICKINWKLTHIVRYSWLSLGHSRNLFQNIL